jgi:hypothetical protein
LLGEEWFGFRTGWEYYQNELGKHEKLRACFIDWQKTFNRVKWTKLMQILNETGIDWCERILVSNL